MPLGEYPILEVIVRQLASQGFHDITMAVNHQANLIKAFFGDGERWGVRVEYSLETQPLSTIAPLCLIPDLPDNFILMNGDVLTDLNFAQLYRDHVQNERLFTIAAARRRHTIDYGVLQVEANRLTGFSEKPTVDYLVSMGVYVLNRTVLKYVPRGQKYGFDNLMTDLLAASQRVHVETCDGYWLDIGRPDDYVQAIDDFETRRKQLLGGAARA
jgi:NDP-sugar pyrophosphorylase family protein